MIRTTINQTILLHICCVLSIAVTPLARAYGHGDWRSLSASLGDRQPHGSQRDLLQLGYPWIDDGGTWPAGFSDLDRATETQRIFRSVAAERNNTAVAAQNLDTAWTSWLAQYNVTYNSTDEAAYRRTVFNYNVQKAQQLNELAGVEVAFGLNRFSALTPEEFLARYTGDAQSDSDIAVSPNQPELINTPAAAAIAAMKAAADAAAAAAANATGNGTAGNGTGDGTSAGGTGGGGGAAPPSGITPPVTRPPTGGTSGPFRVGGSDAADDSSDSSDASGDGSGRALLQQQQQPGQMPPEKQEQRRSSSLWRRLLAALGWHWRPWQPLTSSHRQLPYPYYNPTTDHQMSRVSHSRRLQQMVSTSNPFQPQPFCSKQMPFPYSRIIPFKSVDWLRGGAVTPPKAMSGNCSNSFAYVAAALAESTMLMQGYNGSAQDISEDQIMACLPGGSCSMGGSVHVVLNNLACKGVAAVGTSFGPSVGAYPTAGSAAAAGKCAVGSYHPVATGITGWAWVPNNEFALAQALSRTPAKVSVDASILQSYRAGFLGCNVLSRLTNHAMLAVGYNYQVRAGPPPAGSSEQFTFFNGSEYWMLKNSWGNMGSVDGFVYIRKECPQATPLGMMINRGVIPTWNQTESYKVGRLQCSNATLADQQCSKDLLLRLAGFCAGVDDYLPAGNNANCSCSCVPT